MADVSLKDRIQHAWNAFRGTELSTLGWNYKEDIGSSYSIRPDRLRPRVGNERSIISAIYNRIALDVASVSIQHVKLDDEGRYSETLKTGLNECLTLNANLDQTGKGFIQDVVLSMFDEGVVAIVPVDTTIDPKVSGSFDIQTVRTGKIVEWYPAHVKVLVYNEQIARKVEIIVPKKTVAIVENPLYSIMNEPNSTLQRLIHKLNLLDVMDEKNSSGKLDLIIQLPYVIKSEARKVQAEQRRKDIEFQLQGSKYGIAYTDGTEKITQLNRPAENNFMTQIEYLTRMLYSQLGIDETIFSGTADDQAMTNYYSRSVEPILNAIIEEMQRKFLTKTARTQGHSIMYFRDPFKLVPVKELADIADKFTRNAILSSNELRAIIGYKPSKDPVADELSNKNINQSTDAPVEANKKEEVTDEV